MLSLLRRPLVLLPLLGALLTPATALSKEPELAVELKIIEGPDPIPQVVQLEVLLDGHAPVYGILDITDGADPILHILTITDGVDPIPQVTIVVGSTEGGAKSMAIQSVSITEGPDPIPQITIVVGTVVDEPDPFG